MTPEEFQIVIDKIRPFTNYIYLHVLGEPLLHPQLNEILNIAQTASMHINITSNGGLLKQKQSILLHHNIRQLNISLHDAEENVVPEKWGEYLQNVLDFTTLAAPKSYICLRLWNSTNHESEPFNSLCLQLISEKFNIPDLGLVEPTRGNGIKLAEHIFLQRAPRFNWPDDKQQGTQTQKTCYALRDHIAILADGQIVPCCLDADATMRLGNIFTDELIDVVETTRAKNIKKGFEQRKIVEPICATCGFIID
jgi:radical SAM protein with 4Fe4S-binding SPASM domain